MALYRSPYEAYPFLCDADDDLLSGYFFLLALKLNALNGLEKRGYHSRNYH